VYLQHINTNINININKLQADFADHWPANS
jgi:hypothetical protein